VICEQAIQLFGNRDPFWLVVEQEVHLMFLKTWGSACIGVTDITYGDTKEGIPGR